MIPKKNDMLKLKNLIVSLLSNILILFLFFLLIQNSNSKQSVNFLKFKSVEIPISLVIGMSFIAGSSIGSALCILSKNEEVNY